VSGALEEHIQRHMQGHIKRHALNALATRSGLVYISLLQFSWCQAAGRGLVSDAGVPVRGDLA
jgi:hypothetical protein